MKPLPSIETLRLYFRYEPDTGVIRWNIYTKKVVPGKIAGCAEHERRIKINIDGRLVMAHHVAFALMTGAWPTLKIDHKDGNPFNNRWLNLREVTDVESSQNQPNRAYRGVSWDKQRNKWLAQVQHKHVGLFDTLDEADMAAHKKRLELGFLGEEQYYLYKPHERDNNPHQRK